MLEIAGPAEIFHDLLHVLKRDEQESGTGIQDGTTSCQTGVRAVDHDRIDVALPITEIAHVRDRGERAGIVLILIQSSERHLAVVELISQTGDPERDDRVRYQLGRIERLDGRRNVFLRQDLREKQSLNGENEREREG